MPRSNKRRIWRGGGGVNQRRGAYSYKYGTKQYYYGIKHRSQISAAFLEKNVYKRRGANSCKFGTFRVKQSACKRQSNSIFLKGIFLDSYANPRLRLGLITVKNSPNPSSVYIRLCKHRKKVFNCFCKIAFPGKKKNSLFIQVTD